MIKTCENVTFDSRLMHTGKKTIINNIMETCELGNINQEVR